MAGQVVRDLLDAFKETKDVEIVGVWMTSEEGTEEKTEERDVKRAVDDHRQDFKLFTDEKYFIDDRDLPFDNPTKLPDVFTTFRKQVEPLREAPRDLLQTPEMLPPLPPIVPEQRGPFKIPETLKSTISALLAPLERSPLLDNPPHYPSPTESAHKFRGGQAAAHDRLRHLINSSAASSYKSTRNGLLGQDFSTKLSAWLALGSITARQIHHSLLAFENGQSPEYKDVKGYGEGENPGTAAIRFELLWRDYMRLCTRKFGARLFHVNGFRNETPHWWKSPSNPGPSSTTEDVQHVIQRFLRGETGTGLIDASQRELFHTGYTSNRARQNVASFLAKHMGLDWRLGAEWYESLLVDYDVSSNWGNWQYVAGVGNDPRGEARIFNPVKQAFDYDPHGDYVKAWVPELRGLDDLMLVFQPWLMDEQERKARKLQGKDWVEKPLVKIDFKIEGKGKRGSSAGRRIGGSGGGGNISSGNKAQSAAQTEKGTSDSGSARGRGRGGFRARGQGRGRGGERRGRGRGRGRGDASTPGSWRSQS